MSEAKDEIVRELDRASCESRAVNNGELADRVLSAIDNARHMVVPIEPTDLMAREGFKELPVEGVIEWPHLLNVYRTMTETAAVASDA